MNTILFIISNQNVPWYLLVVLLILLILLFCDSNDADSRNLLMDSLLDHTGVLFKIEKIDSHNRYVRVATRFDMDTLFKTGGFPTGSFVIKKMFPIELFPKSFLENNILFMATRKDADNLEFQRWKWTYNTMWVKDGEPISQPILEKEDVLV